MTTTQKLLRFFYLGGHESFYVRRKDDKTLIDEFEAVKELVCDDSMTAEHFLELIRIHKTAMDVWLPRYDEMWFAYAIFLSESTNQKERSAAYTAFPTVIATSEDFFLFVRYAWKIQEKKKRNGFSHTVRKAINLWYRKRTELELVEMFALNRGKHGFTHKDVIAMCHVNMDKAGIRDLFNALFHRAGKALLENGAVVAKDPEAMARLNVILQLKSCTDPEIASNLIRANQLKYENVPNSLLNEVKVWEALLPSLKFSQLLQHIFTLFDFKLFDDAALHRAYVQAVADDHALVSDSITPVSLLACSKKLRLNQRHSDKMKQTYHIQKVGRNQKPPSPLITDAVGRMLLNSFNLFMPRLGLKLHITINLQTGYNKKPVINQKQVSATEAAMTLAFMFFCAEPNVEVYTYTPMVNVLEEVRWNKDTNYQHAVEICRAKETPKNKQRLCSPVFDAIKRNVRYDVFLIIIPSGARGNPCYKPARLIRSLNDYRIKNQSLNARVIIVNLRRCKPSMIHTKSYEDNGILEICGFTEDTVKLINAFATRRFS